MNQVSRRTRWWLAAGVVLALATVHAAAQAPPAGPLAVYRELRSVGLDPGRVYRVRDVTLDRQALHLVFNDGTIALTRAVDGRITGAFFEGDGEVLASPSSRVERASLALFSDAAILEEKFTTAYLRFNDDTWKEFEDGQSAEAEAQDFVARWNGVAQTLAGSDSIRLLKTWIDAPRPDDRMLRARLGTVHFGTLDVSYDALAREPITVAQVAHVEAGTFYDVWTQFAPGARAEPPKRERSIQISKYRIDAHVEPPHDLSADSKLSVTSRQGGERLMSFELSRYLKLNAVMEIGGGRATPLDFIQNEALEGSQLARRGNDVVFVILARPLSAGVPVRLKFTYAGPVLSEAGGGLMYVGARGTWYPNHGPQMADFDLQFRSPAEWVLLATGKRVESEVKNGEQISRWVSEHPIPLAGFNLGRYDRVSSKAGNVTVTAYATRSVENNFVTNRRPPPDTSLTIPNWGPTLRTPTGRPPVLAEMPALPPDPLLHAKAVAEISAHTIEWLAPKLGDFPFSSLALTQMPGVVSQGWPGMVFLSSYVFMADEERTQRQLSPMNQLLYRKVMPIHETIHQWWGDEVAWRSYRDQWIVEAMSNYLALMTLEREKPESARSLLDYYRAELLTKVHDEPMLSAGPVTLGVRLTSSKFPAAYEAVSYGRGTWLIHMLREMLRDGATGARSRGRAARDSDELFFKALRSILEQNRYRAIDNAELQKAFEEVLPASAQYEGRKSLDWFFDEWVNGTAIPHLELTDVKISLRGGRTVATGKIAQKDAPKTLVTCVPLYALGGAGAKPLPAGRVFADEEETSFRLNVPAGTKKLLLDPNGTILSRP